VEFEPVIGLEVHAELQTQSKMFCACPVVDSTQAAPNTTVCPVCAGMPGMLPVVNQKAVEYGLRVALALGCEINPTSIFARKNYFYPDLPKGYQISQYELPLAENGRLIIRTLDGEESIRIRRVHLEEDTGKLTHVGATRLGERDIGVGATRLGERDIGVGATRLGKPGTGGAAPLGELDAESTSTGRPYTLLDLNRAGVPLLEIVSEPDLRSVEAARAYGEALREILRYLEVNSGDMEKGVIRFEANVSVRPKGRQEFGTRVEIKNLNSFRALERACIYEIERQSRLLASGGTVEQETLGWDEARQRTYSQRSKEDAHDYRYFPEPDLPPLVVPEAWVEQIRAALPELPREKSRRFVEQYGLTEYDAALLTAEKVVADYFEAAVNEQASMAAPKTLANWVTGDLFALLNQAGGLADLPKVPPEALAGLVNLAARGEINQSTGKEVLAEMFASGQSAGEIVERRGLRQVSDSGLIADLVRQVLESCPDEVTSYRSGKETVANWLFGQVMKKAAGKANPQVVRQELERQLKA
jgi:aspartyl-tRNA(Asn)/glutamyl-tRNA(Gln) amidotransferase subunit B